MRRRLPLRTVVLWLELGFKLSWRKGSRGRQLEGSGAQISSWMSATGVPGVEIAIALDRVEKLAKCCKDLLGQQMIQRQSVRELAGLASWMSSIRPQMSPFATMLWAACNAAVAPQVAVEHVRKPLWMSAMCEMDMRPIVRRCRHRAA